MLSVDVIVYHNNEARISVANSKIERIMQDLDLQHTFSVLPEYLLERGTLLDESPLPEEAIVAVHGNMLDKYLNIRDTRRLSEQRHDLRFIVSVDRDYVREGMFQTREDYEFTQGALSRECHPQYPITVTPVNLLGFLTGKDITYDIEESFERYMQRWKALREGSRT